MTDLGYNRKIILEDGEEYLGYAFGANVGDKVLELVFNTSMVGYQEILSDPSYADQAVLMTYTLMGNYGMAADDYESERPAIGALIVRENNDEPSSFRSEETLAAVMERWGIPGVCGLDTRKLTRSLRDKGTRKCLITSAGTTLEEGLKILAATPVPTDAVARTSCEESRTFPVEGAAHHVVVVDCGMRRYILRALNARGCNVTVVPWNTSAEAILALNPDGVVVSDGPGDPTHVAAVADTVKTLRGKVPMLGISLGCQLVAMAYGAKTEKLKFGHRGANHPVKELATGRVEITSQNHSYVVEEDSLQGTNLQVTHRNLLDNTVEGVVCPGEKVMGVQHHPDGESSSHVFDRFVSLMEEVAVHA